MPDPPRFRDALRDLLADHAAPFAAGPRAWLCVARHAVPVVGVAALGWSRELTVFAWWADGVTLLLALCVLAALDVCRDDELARTGPLPLRLLLTSLAIVMGVGILGLPCAFALGIMRVAVFQDGFGALAQADPTLWWGVAALTLGTVARLVLDGVPRLEERARVRRFQWEYMLILGRMCSIMLLTFVLPMVLVPALAFALAYAEIWPRRALRFWGAPVDDGDAPEGELPAGEGAPPRAASAGDRD